MSHELHYTSVPRGLKPGSRGFCTVGQTPHMPGPLVDRLEALSAYQPVFPPHDPAAALNPIVFSHLRLTIGGKVLSVLSRIGPAGLDYSGRPNKYAHHVVLEAPERPEGGPAWLLSQPGFMQRAWEGEPREIPSGRIPPQGDRQPGVARNWQTLTGDGGWAGVLAETFLADSRRTVFLVFRPGMDLLPLFVEALALVPASRRWDVDFSTYFNQLPQGVTCAWRGVLEGSDDAKTASRLPNALLLDLCQASGRAEGGALVHLARTGERITQEPATTTTPPGNGRHIPRMPQEPVVPHAGPAGRPRAIPPLSTGGAYELLPELARLVPGAASTEAWREVGRDRRRWKRYAVGAALLVACIVPLFAAAFLFDFGKSLQMVGIKSDVVANAVKPRGHDANKTELPEVTKPPGADHPETVQGRLPNVMVPKKTELPPLIPKVEPPKKNIATPAPSGSVVANPVVEKGKITEPAVVFFPLPKLREGLATLLAPDIPRTYDQQIPGVPKDMSEISLLPNSERELHAVRKEGEMEVKTTAIGDLVPIARFKADENKLQFTWLAEAKRENQSTSALRDGILHFTREGQQHFILLRRPSTPDSRAFDLTNKPDKKHFRPLLRDDYKPREISFPWADRDSLAGTTWKLAIRGWKLVSRFNEHDPELVIAEAENKGTWTESVDAPITPGDEVKLTIRIDSPSNPHLVKVRFEFQQAKIKKSQKERDDERHDIERKLRRLGDKKDRDQSDKDKREQLEARKLDLEKTDKIYDSLWQSRDASLSLIIGLKIDPSTTVDIAKFGDVGAPAH